MVFVDPQFKLGNNITRERIKRIMKPAFIHGYNQVKEKSWVFSANQKAISTPNGKKITFKYAAEYILYKLFEVKNKEVENQEMTKNLVKEIMGHNDGPPWFKELATNDQTHWFAAKRSEKQITNYITALLYVCFIYTQKKYSVNEFLSWLNIMSIKDNNASDSININFITQTKVNQGTGNIYFGDGIPEVETMKFDNGGFYLGHKQEKRLKRLGIDVNSIYANNEALCEPLTLYFLKAANHAYNTKNNNDQRQIQKDAFIKNLTKRPILPTDKKFPNYKNATHTIKDNFVRERIRRLYNPHSYLGTGYPYDLSDIDRYIKDSWSDFKSKQQGYATSIITLRPGEFNMRHVYNVHFKLEDTATGILCAIKYTLEKNLDFLYIKLCTSIHNIGMVIVNRRRQHAEVKILIYDPDIPPYASAIIFLNEKEGEIQQRVTNIINQYLPCLVKNNTYTTGMGNMINTDMLGQIASLSCYIPGYIPDSQPAEEVIINEEQWIIQDSTSLKEILTVSLFTNSPQLFELAINIKSDEIKIDSKFIKKLYGSAALGGHHKLQGLIKTHLNK